jgi:hypothetical protein
LAGLGKGRRLGWAGQRGEYWGLEMKRGVVVLDKNTRRCVKKKKRKTERWEDKPPYIHRFPYPTLIPNFLLSTSLSSILRRIFLH